MDLRDMWMRAGQKKTCRIIFRMNTERMNDEAMGNMNKAVRVSPRGCP
jgi:hypothetical protein